MHSEEQIEIGLLYVYEQINFREVVTGIQHQPRVQASIPLSAILLINLRCDVGLWVAGLVWIKNTLISSQLPHHFPTFV